MTTDPGKPGLPIFKATVGASDLRRIVDVLEVVSPEARLDVQPDGIRCAQVGPDYTSMSVVQFGRALFEEYSVGRAGVVGVDVRKLREVLKIPRTPYYMEKANREPVFVVSFDGGDRPRLTVTLQTPAGGTVVRTMAAVDPSAIHDPKVPTLTPRITAAEVDADALSVAVKKAAGVAPEAFLGRTKTGVLLTAEREGRQEGLHALPAMKETAEIGAGAVEGRGRALFPLETLGEMVGALKPAVSTVSLKWGTDEPLCVEFSLPHVARWVDVGRFNLNRGKCTRKAKESATPGAITGRYLLAPHIPDDGEPIYEIDASRWFAGFMRRGRELSPDPDFSAASVDSVSSVALETELGKRAAKEAEYRRAYAAYLEQSAVYAEKRRAFVARWLETRDKEPADRTIRSEIGYPPRAPYAPEVAPDVRRPEPYPGESAETFTRRTRRETARRVEERRAEGRKLRGRFPSGISWVVKQPEPGAPKPEVSIAAFEVPAHRGVTEEEYAEARAAADAQEVAESQALDTLPDDATPEEAGAWVAVPADDPAHDPETCSACVAEVARTDAETPPDDPAPAPAGPEPEISDPLPSEAPETAPPPPVAEAAPIPAAPDDFLPAPPVENATGAVPANPNLSSEAPEARNGQGRRKPGDDALRLVLALIRTGCPDCNGSMVVRSRRYAYTCGRCVPGPVLRIGPAGASLCLNVRRVGPVRAESIAVEVGGHRLEGAAAEAWLASNVLPHVGFYRGGRA